jgi:hypothetical protein
MGGPNRGGSAGDEDGMSGFHEIFTPELYVVPPPPNSINGYSGGLS